VIGAPACTFSFPLGIGQSVYLKSPSQKKILAILVEQQKSQYLCNITIYAFT
jgi:hypothetical protein